MTDGAAPQTKPALSFWQIWNMCFSFHNQPISALALGGSGLFTLRVHEPAATTAATAGGPARTSA